MDCSLRAKVRSEELGKGQQGRSTPAGGGRHRADLGAEMFGIASDFEEGCGTGLQQEVVQEFLVLQGERRQFMR